MRGAMGTTDWHWYEIELSVPSGARSINFGMTVDGKGAAWCDAIRIEVNAELSRGRYKVALDNTTAYTGRQSLKLQFDWPGLAPGLPNYHDDLRTYPASLRVWPFGCIRVRGWSGFVSGHVELTIRLPWLQGCRCRSSPASSTTSWVISRRDRLRSQYLD
jgi:hypothetical protein